MIDQRIIEEIVRRVLERLLADPRFAAAVATGRPAEDGGRPVAGARPRSGYRHNDRLLSEWDVLKVHRSGGRLILLDRSTIVTPLASERARDLGVKLLFE